MAEFLALSSLRLFIGVARSAPNEALGVSELEDTLLTVLELVKAGTCSVELQLAVLELISLLSVARDSKAMFQRCRVLDTVLVLKDTRESTGAVRRAATKLLLSLAQDMPSASPAPTAFVAAPLATLTQAMGNHHHHNQGSSTGNGTQQQKESAFGTRKPELRSLSLDIRGALTGADRPIIDRYNRALLLEPGVTSVTLDARSECYTVYYDARFLDAPMLIAALTAAVDAPTSSSSASACSTAAAPQLVVEPTEAQVLTLLRARLYVVLQCACDEARDSAGRPRAVLSGIAAATAAADRVQAKLTGTHSASSGYLDDPEEGDEETDGETEDPFGRMGGKENKHSGGGPRGGKGPNWDYDDPFAGALVDTGAGVQDKSAGERLKAKAAAAGAGGGGSLLSGISSWLGW